MTSIIIPAGSYRLSRSVKNPTPDRRRTRDWRALAIWSEGEEFIVREQRRDLAGLDLARLPDDKRARVEATMLYTVVEMVGQDHPCLHRVGPGNAEQYAALAAALVPTEESLAQFMARIELESGFVRWLVDRGEISRADIERLWNQFQYGDPEGAPNGDDATTLDAPVEEE